MKRFKRLAALALSAVLALSLTVPAFAAQGDDTTSGTTPETVDTTDTTGSGTGGDTTGDGSSPSTGETGSGDTTGGSDTTDTSDAGKKGVIQITNATPGSTYSAYKLFDVETVKDETTGNVDLLYTMAADSPWKEFFTGWGGGTSYITATEDADKSYYTITWNENQPETEDNAKLLAKAAKKFADDSNIVATGTCAYEGDASTTTAKITGLESGGYYLVTSSKGNLRALCTLRKDTTSSTVQLDDKQNQPTVKKQVWEDRKKNAPSGSDFWGDNNNWGSENDADIGQTVYYRAIIKNAGGQVNCTLVDFMYPGLTPNKDSVKVYKNDGTLVEANNYTTQFTPDWDKMGDSMLMAAAGMYDDEYGMETRMTIDHNMGSVNAGIDLSGFTNCTFYVRFNDNFLEEVGEEEELVVCYEALLNKNALISPRGNQNIAVLGYGRGDTTLAQAGQSMLAQAGQSMLAQANQSNQGVLSELQSMDDSFGGYAGDDDFSVGDEGLDAQSSEKLSSGNKIDRTEGLAASLKGYQGSSMTSDTMTYTYQLDMVKVNGASNLLTGAKFTLKDSADNAISLVPYTPGNEEWKNWNVSTLGQANQIPQGVLSLLQDGADILVETVFDVKDVTYAYRPAMPGETGTVTVFEAGIVTFAGLDEGTYTLEEIAPPEGYNKAQPIEFIIMSNVRLDLDAGPAGHLVVNHNVSALNTSQTAPRMAVFSVDNGKTWSSMTVGENFIRGTENGFFIDMSEGGMAVVNLVGNELPHTGGIGTTIFYVVGGVLVVGAGVLLVVKKRMKDDNTEE